uniref:Uncharacterized protein n=1 Tax=Cacopsylla melanoneura TaxID=428564 RepID=A0A8D8S211_9HEMI
MHRIGALGIHQLSSHGNTRVRSVYCGIIVRPGYQGDSPSAAHRNQEVLSHLCCVSGRDILLQTTPQPTQGRTDWSHCRNTTTPSSPDVRSSIHPFTPTPFYHPHTHAIHPPGA